MAQASLVHHGNIAHSGLRRPLIVPPYCYLYFCIYLYFIYIIFIQCNLLLFIYTLYFIYIYFFAVDVFFLARDEPRKTSIWSFVTKTLAEKK